MAAITVAGNATSTAPDLRLLIDPADNGARCSTAPMAGFGHLPDWPGAQRIQARAAPPKEQATNWMYDLDFSPPEELEISLWRSLLINLADRFAPERLPPLQLTSKPVEVGILEGDLLSLPWYRTVFSNLGDVISPETLPPLELESTPVDVGELLGDELSHGWWDSLLQGIRDRLAPQKLPPLQLTSSPVAGFGAEESLQILDWSDLIAGPKIFQPDVPQAVSTVASVEPSAATAVAETAPVDRGLFAARMQLVRDIGKTNFRRRIWISLAAAEAVLLLVALFKLQ